MPKRWDSNYLTWVQLKTHPLPNWQGHATEILSKLPRQHVEAIPPSVGNETSCLFQAVFNLKLSVKKGDIHEQG
jgi:hypothetical protein